MAEQVLKKINMDIQGDRVMVSGLLDLKGLKALEKKIVGLKALLEPDDVVEDDQDENQGL
ncbi:hypothetical protein EAH87_16155 [Sphingomonas koreensis]|nr:hypothetical protein EAH87_16155 [Sphingomonas koreensis]